MISTYNIRARWAKYKWVASCDELLSYTVAPHTGPKQAIDDLAATLAKGRPAKLYRVTSCWYRLVVSDDSLPATKIKPNSSPW